MTAQRFEFSATAIPLTEDRSSNCGREVTTTLSATPLAAQWPSPYPSGTPFALVEDAPATPKAGQRGGSGPALASWL